jgi:small subunit ribosomal protein S16
VAVRIRLRRIGKKKQPQYRLIVADSASPRDGRFIETIGRYNPRVDPAAVSVDEERALWWLQHGAQPSDTAKSMLTKVGVWERFTGEPRPVQAAASKPAAEAEREAVAEPAEAAPQEPAETPTAVQDEPGAEVEEERGSAEETD